MAAQDPCVGSVGQTLCSRGLNPTIPPAARRLWVPSSAVRLGYMHTAGAVASGRLAQWRLAHSLAGSVAGLGPLCGSVLDVPRSPAHNHLRVLPSTHFLVGGPRWPGPGGRSGSRGGGGAGVACCWRARRGPVARGGYVRVKGGRDPGCHRVRSGQGRARVGPS